MSNLIRTQTTSLVAVKYIMMSTKSMHALETHRVLRRVGPETLPGVLTEHAVGILRDRIVILRCR